MLLNWQTGVVVPFFRRGPERVLQLHTGWANFLNGGPEWFLKFDRGAKPEFENGVFV